MRSVSKQLIAAFLATQLVALFVGYQFLSQEVSIVENPEDAGNAVRFFIQILVSTAVLLLVLHFYKGKRLFQAVEYLLEFSAIQIFASLFVSAEYSLAAAIALVGLRILAPDLKMFFLLFATAVVGGLLGASLGIVPAILLSALLAIYDVYAVFGSKHMIVLAKQMQERGAAFAVHLNDKKKKESITLGTGDVVIPAMIVVSSIRLSDSLLPAAFALIGAVAGLMAMIYVLEKNKGYWPALPPLVFGSLSFLGAYMAIAFFF